MKINTTQVTKITLSDMPRLDNIDIILEDYHAGCGEITIKCWDKVWTNVWGAMGKDRTIIDFFLECDNGYISGKMFKGEIDELDPDLLEAHFKKEIIRQRIEGEYDEYGARSMWCDLNYVSFSDVTDYQSLHDCADGVIEELFGSEWWDSCYPTRITSKYEYFLRVLEQVRIGLKEYMSLDVV